MPQYDIDWSAIVSGLASQPAMQYRQALSVVHDATQVRLWFASASGSTANLVLSNVTIGERDGSTYNFTGSPTTITFNGGSASVSIAAGGYIVSSDWIGFTLDHTKTYLVHINFASGGGSPYGSAAAVSKASAVDESTSITISGYSATINKCLYRLDSLAITSQTQTVTGGIVVGGSATVSGIHVATYTQTVSGGVVIGGYAINNWHNAGYTQNVDGGVVLGGSAIINEQYVTTVVQTVTGGVVLGGTVTVVGNHITSVTQTTIGGIVLGGSAIVTAVNMVAYSVGSLVLDILPRIARIPLNNGISFWLSLNAVADTIYKRMLERHSDLLVHDLYLTLPANTHSVALPYGYVSMAEKPHWHKSGDTDRNRMSPRYLDNDTEQTENEWWSQYGTQVLDYDYSHDSIMYKIIGNSMHVWPLQDEELTIEGRFNYRLMPLTLFTDVVPWDGLFDEVFREGICMMIQLGVNIPENNPALMAFIMQRVDTVLNSRVAQIPATGRINRSSWL